MFLKSSTKQSIHGKRRRRRISARQRTVAVHRAIEPLERRALFTVTAGTPAEASLSAAYAGGSLGINLATNDSFSTGALWTDARKTMAAWQYANQNGTVLSGPDLLKNGYPSGTSASNAAYTDTEMLGYPDGIYTLSYQGAGTVTVGGNGTIVSGSTVTSTVNGVATTTAQVSLKKDTGGNLYLYANNFTTSSPLSNLHLMMPGYAANTTQVFNPAALARITPFSTIRIMDLFRVVSSTLANWADRPLPTDFTATGAYGVSIEDAIALGNETQTNLWWNIPIDATDDFVMKLAQTMKYGSDANGNPYTNQQLNPVNPPLNSNLKVHIELADELFVPGSTAYNDNHTAALANVSAGILDGSQSDINGEESLLRLRQIHDDFAGVYNANVNDLSSHIGFIWTGSFDSLTGQVLPFTSDAIAFSFENNGLNGDNNPSNWGPLSSWLEAMATSNYHGLINGQNPTTLDTLFGDLQSDLAEYGPSADKAMVNYAMESAGLPLVAYEGGVTLTPTTAAQLTLYTAASDDQRMDAFDQSMLNDWDLNGGGLFNYYALATDYNYFGTWGLLQYEDQPGTNKFDGAIKRVVTSGDANLDGSVDFNDFLALKANWLKSGAFWQQGDFNSDGTVNAGDLAILNGAINKSAFTAAQLAEYNSFYQFAMTGTASPSVGTGLYGAYFSDLNQTTKVLGRVDPTIDFTWPQGGTGPDPSVGQAYFSTQWTGQIEAQTNETYTIHTYSDDGIRVYITVNGVKQTVISDYTNGSHEDVGDITLQAGQKYAIEVDYFQQYGGANVKLQWQTPTIPQEDIPTTMMYPATAPAAITGLSASGSAGAITLSFPAVSGATSYNVYRSTAAGGEGTSAYLTGITSASNTVSITDTAVNPGRTYYYKITAVDIVGESAPSYEVSAASSPVAGAPTAAPIVTATSSAGAIGLSYSAVSGATSYSIYRGTTPGGENTTALVSGVTATSFSDSTVLPGTRYYYTVTANNASGSSVFSNEASGTAAVPAQLPLSDSDIGSPGQSGSASFNSTNGTYTISGGGADIYGSSDQFNFDSTSLTGNQTLITRVASETATDYSTKAGLMFRQSASSTDSFADVMVTPGQGVVFEWRDASNGSYSSTAVAGFNAPAWVKLTRSGNTFTGYYSLDGITWMQVASKTIAMNSSVLSGLAVCAHNNNLLASAAFTNVTIGSATPIAISSFTVNDGSLQRSMVRTVTLTFNTPVTLDGTALSLTNATTSTALTFTASSPDGGTTYVITPTSGINSAGSLSDANYSLVVNPSGVHSVASPSTTMTSQTVTEKFYRLFGDANGDGTVNLVDYRAFVSSYLKTTGQSGFNSVFDTNNDGTINLIDYRAFVANYLHTITN